MINQLRTTMTTTNYGIGQLVYFKEAIKYNSGNIFNNTTKQEVFIVGKPEDVTQRINGVGQLVETTRDDIEKDLSQIQKSRKELQIAVRESWWAPVSHQVENKQIETQAALKLASSRETEMSQLNYRLTSLKKSLDNNICSQCGSVLPNSNIGATKSEITEIEIRIKQLSEPISPTLESLLSESQRLGFFALPRKADSIRTLEKQIRLLLNEIPARNQEIKEIGQKLMVIS